MAVLVNLLPTAYRKPEVGSVQQFVRSPLALIAAAALAGLAGLLLMLAQVRQAALAQVEVQLREVQPKRQAIEELAKTVQMYTDQRGVLERVVQSHSQWARRLNQLSNVTPEGVWFTDLLIDLDKGLVLQGSAIGQGGAEMVQIGRLAQDLKADAVFSAVVRDIQIQSIESVQDQETEVVKFTLTGTMVNPFAAPTPKR